MTNLFDNIPPHDEEMERHVLGAMLLDRDSQATASEMLTPDDFYSTRHARTFAAAKEIYIEKGALDAALLRLKLPEEDAALWLAGLAASVPTSAHTEHYAKVVADKARVRRLIAAATEIVRSAYEGGDSNALIEDAEQKISRIARGVVNREAPRDISTILEDVLESFEKGSAAAIRTGFPSLDYMLDGGLYPQWVTVVAARTKVGKTAVGGEIALQAMKRGKRVFWVAAEMSDIQMAQRWLTALMGQSLRHVDRPKNFSEEENAKLSNAIAFLTTNAPTIKDRGYSTPAICAEARRYRERGELDLLCVDYLQILQHADLGKNSTDASRITESMHALKRIGSELNVPVLLLAQCRRDGGPTPDPTKKPSLSELKGSGSIAEDADAVLLVWRDKEDAKMSHAELAANRHGPTGSFDLFTDFPRMQIGEWLDAARDAALNRRKDD